MGKRRRPAAVHHEAAECDMWLSTSCKKPKSSNGVENCNSLNQMCWPAKNSAAAVKQTSLLNYFVTKRKYDTSEDCVTRDCVIAGCPTSTYVATPGQDMSCELSTNVYKASDFLYHKSDDDSKDLCLDSMFQVAAGYKAIPDIGTNRTSHRVAAGCQNILDSETNCLSLRYVDSCKTVPDITTNLQSTEITADSDNLESQTGYRVVETQNGTIVTGQYSAVAGETVLVHDTSQGRLTDSTVVPESLEAMTCAPLTVKSQYYETCVVQDSLEVASCNLNSMQSESNDDIVTIPDSLVESSCFCEEVQIYRQSEQEHYAFDENTKTVIESFAAAGDSRNSLNISSSGDKVSLHLDLDPFMLDSVDLDSNIGRITNTQKVNLFEMELELMKQYPGDVSELASLENTQSLV